MTDPADVTLVSADGEAFTFPFSCMNIHFHIFSHGSTAGATLKMPYTSDAIRRLEKALSDPFPQAMTVEDISLLNYLELKDFRDAFKLYDDSHARVGYHRVVKD